MTAQDIIRRNAVTIHGADNKIPMVFAHGFGIDQNIWRLVVSKFSNKYKLITFDYVGGGKSDRSQYSHERYASLDGYVSDLKEVCQALTLENAIFVGHSISCMIGLKAAIENSDLFDRLVFIAPSPSYINEQSSGYNGGFEKQDVMKFMSMMDEDYEGWAKTVIPSVVHSAQLAEFKQEILKSFLSYDHAIARQFALATFFADHRKDLLKLNKPCLILQAQEDMMAPLQAGDYLHAHLQHSTLRLLEAKGHFPQLTASLEVASAISDYLRGTSTPSLIALN